MCIYGAYLKLDFITLEHDLPLKILSSQRQEHDSRQLPAHSSSSFNPQHHWSQQSRNKRLSKIQDFVNATRKGETF